MWCQDFFWRWRSTYLREAALPRPLLTLDALYGLQHHRRDTFDGAPKSSLPFREISCSSGKELQAIAKAFEHLLGGEDFDARCRKLYGQGQTVEPVADLCYGWGALVGNQEIRLGGLCPLHEEPYRFVLSKTLHREWPLRVRQGERRYRILVLSVEPQGYAACG